MRDTVPQGPDNRMVSAGCVQRARERKHSVRPWAYYLPWYLPLAIVVVTMVAVSAL
jgi:hypothetical protein